VTAVRVVGLEELRRALIEAARTSEAEVAKASEQAAHLVAAAARRKAPAGPHEGSDRVETVRASVAAGRAGLAGTVSIGGPSAPHAEVVNFGGTIPRRGVSRVASARAQRDHQSFTRYGVTSLTKIVAREFLYSSISAHNDEVLHLYVAAVDRVMGRAFPS
jgi:hypothetical protein